MYMAALMRKVELMSCDTYAPWGDSGRRLPCLSFLAPLSKLLWLRSPASACLSCGRWSVELLRWELVVIWLVLWYGLLLALLVSPPREGKTVAVTSFCNMRACDIMVERQINSNIIILTRTTYEISLSFLPKLHSWISLSLLSKLPP